MAGTVEAVRFLGIVLTGIGTLFALVVAVGRWRTYRAIDTLEPTDVEAVDSTGLLELEGQVVADDTFEEPLTGQTAVVAAWQVEEWKKSGNSTKWRTVGTAVESVPFEVDDGTGTAPADLSPSQEAFDPSSSTDPGVVAEEGLTDIGLLVEFDRFDVVTRNGVDGDTPESVRQVERWADVSVQSGAITNVVDVGKKRGDRRYYAQAIGPNDHVYVRGEAVADDRQGAAVVNSPDDLTIVSNLSEEEIMERMVGGYRILLAASAVLTAVIVGLFTLT